MSNFLFECIELNLQTPTDFFGRFVFKPLPSGHGITLGNLFRRVLLTNLPGTSIVGARIAGISHEFSTIPGVREDVLEILLNLKDLIFKGESKTGSIGRLKVQGPAIITANQLVLPNEISLVNPTQYLATIADTTTFELEVKIETGIGYLLAENRLKKNHYPNDFLSIDAIFMPVHKVVYRVESIETDNLQNEEQVILDIWTNGSITPTKAISLAAKEISEWLTPILNIEQSSINIAVGNSGESNYQSPSFIKEMETEKINFRSSQNQDPFAFMSIEELNLSARAFNSLRRAEILMVGDLLKYSLQDLGSLKNFGQKSLEEVVDALKNKCGVSLQ
jgi:DNA-directed RNA polymerase subunit alpha